MNESPSAGPPDPADVVARIWSEVFEVDQVRPEDDFFVLGGHSMTAVRIASRLRAELGLRVPVRTILDNPTVGTLAATVAGAARVAGSASRPSAEGGSPA